jgi:hypothetical protein
VTTGGIHALLERHWAASAAGDVVAEHDIYDENVVCEYPQRGFVVAATCKPCGDIIQESPVASMFAALWEPGSCG